MGRASERSYMSIREVLDLLKEEFPDVTISKIRFLESRGLIHPERTPSGYRKFFDVDVERLAWILRQQREHFLPLKVIKGRLEQLNGDGPGHHAPSLFESQENGFEDEFEEFSPNGDSRQRHPSASPVLASAPEPDPEPEELVAVAPELEPTVVAVEPAPVVVERVAVAARVTRTPEVSDGTFSRAELAAQPQADVALICELEEYGLIAPREIAGEECFDSAACQLVGLAARFRGYGIEARHLKSLKHAAAREAGLFSQVVTPLLLQRNPLAREKAEENLADLVSLGAALREVLVNGELRGYTGG
jgi:DNA-binding transcriptional MerR regulator